MLEGSDGASFGDQQYLETVLALNARRNEVLLAGLARIVGALNAIDISPMPLKGAARLIAADYPAPMLRLLGDLDVLIPAERSASAVVALQSIGFPNEGEWHCRHPTTICKRSMSAKRASELSFTRTLLAVRRRSYSHRLVLRANQPIPVSGPENSFTRRNTQRRTQHCA